MSDGGKGSSPRPISVPFEEYASSWDKVFKKKETLIERMDYVEENVVTDEKPKTTKLITEPNEYFD